MRRSAQWALDVAVVGTAGDRDFRGPAVQGKRGERFVYLTWGDVAADGAFVMFRRAKLMLADVDAACSTPPSTTIASSSRRSISATSAADRAAPVCASRRSSGRSTTDLGRGVDLKFA